jgi:predicted flap endonuclease-1-like 5' DNA nuclease
VLIVFIGRPDEERKAESKPETVTEADDLTKIEGIGPKVSRTLIEAGISTFEALSSATVEDIQKILTDAGLKMMDATTWPQQAELAAKGDWEALKKLQDNLSGGRKGGAEKKPAAKKTSKK